MKRSHPVYSDQAADAAVQALQSLGLDLTDEQAQAITTAIDHCDEPDEIDADYDCDDDYDIEFADPGGNSALRAASRDNPRNLPCPTCRTPNKLTPADRARGYQCDSCADTAESGRGH